MNSKTAKKVWEKYSYAVSTFYKCNISHFAIIICILIFWYTYKLVTYNMSPKKGPPTLGGTFGNGLRTLWTYSSVEPLFLIVNIKVTC